MADIISVDNKMGREVKAEMYIKDGVNKENSQSYTHHVCCQP